MKTRTLVIGSTIAAIGTAVIGIKRYFDEKDRNRKIKKKAKAFLKECTKNNDNIMATIELLDQIQAELIDSSTVDPREINIEIDQLTTEAGA